MLEFTVEGMSCGHCVGAVTRAVKAIDADAAVEIDLATQKVRVESSADAGVISAAIVEAGYPVTATA